MGKVAGRGRYRRLSAGQRLLECWSESASQIEKNSLYEALFAVSSGSVFRWYTVLTRPAPTRGLVILVRDNLVLKVGLPDSETFVIEYIGPPGIARDYGAAA